MRSCSPATQRPHVVDQPYLVSWNNKQAPRLGGRRRQVLLRPAPAPADDRATASGAGSAGSAEDGLDRARAGDGGAGDAGPARPYRAAADPRCARSASRRTAELRQAVATLRRWRARRRPPARPRRGRHLRRRRGRDADGRLVAAAGRGASSGPRSATTRSRRCESMLPRRRPRPAASPTRPPSSTAGGATSTRTCAACSAASPRGLAPRLLRPRLARALPPRPAPLAGARRWTSAPHELYGHGDCEADPAPECFDRNRATVASGIEHRRLPVPEPPDLPADGVDPARRAVGGLRRQRVERSRPGPLLAILRRRPQGRFVRACRSTPGATRPHLSDTNSRADEGSSVRKADV